MYWGHSSILEAELLCLQDLLHNNKPWEYAIDLTGSEVENQLMIDIWTVDCWISSTLQVMMWTNQEIVKHLQRFPGEIYTESYPLPLGNRGMVERKERFQYKRN